MQPRRPSLPVSLSTLPAAPEIWITYSLNVIKAFLCWPRFNQFFRAVLLFNPVTIPPWLCYPPMYIFYLRTPLPLPLFHQPSPTTTLFDSIRAESFVRSLIIKVNKIQPARVVRRYESTFRRASPHFVSSRSLPSPAVFSSLDPASPSPSYKSITSRTLSDIEY